MRLLISLLVVGLAFGCKWEDDGKSNVNIKAEDGSTVIVNRESSDATEVVIIDGDSDSNLDSENSHNTTTNEAAAIKKAEAKFRILAKELGLTIE